MERRRWEPFSLTCLIFTLLAATVVWGAEATAAFLNLAWDDVSDNEIGFKVERRLSGGTFAQVATPGTNTTSYVDTGLADGTTYCYQVRAYNAAGDSAPSNEACGTTPISAPQNFTLNVNKSGSGDGTVNGPGISCGSDCFEAYSSGTAVTLTAVADTDSTFTGWSGGGCGGTGSCTILTNTDIIVTATFNPAPPSGPRVASLTLINADTDQPLAGFDPLLDGATVNFATLPTQNLSIRANATDVGSVRFDLDGVVNYQTENGAPYALAGDNSGDYNAWTPSLGSHTVTVVPYPEANLGGTAGTPLTITFTVVNESAPQNTAPSVNAGADQAITLPTNSVALSGSASDDGLPNPPGQVSYTWSQVAGPAPVTFGTSDAASTTVSFSSDGTYTLRLQVSDGALSASDEVSITVNPAPPSGPRVASLTLINADTDQPLAGFDPLQDGVTLDFATLPTQNLSIRANATDVGSVRFDLDGVVNYQTENGAPYALAGDNSGDYNAWTPSLGSHTVTVVPYPEANLGGTAGTPLTITFTVVNESAPQNTAPSVNAGADQAITLPTNSVALSGSASDDGLPNPPGQVSYTWSQVAGPAPVTFGTSDAASTTVSFSSDGTYTLRLQVSDGALSASDEVSITVNPAPPSGPRVASLTLINADTDQPLAGFDPLLDGATVNFATLPTQNLSIRANATDVGSVRFDLDGVVNYQTENGAPYALAGDNSGDYNAWTPSLGSHTVTVVPYPEANLGGTAGTPLTITFTVVNESAPQNTAPSVNAGADQAITLPTNSVALSGSASDDGLPNPPGQVSYTWSQVAGPAPVTFGTSDAASTTVSFSSDGTYTLRLQVSDGALSASDEVSITVNPAPPSGPRVASLTLINADTDQPLAGFDPLQDGVTLDFATLPTQNLSIRANATDVGSVRFDLDGVVNYQTENGAPYALAGDNSGDYNAWTPSLGSHTVTVVPYPEANLGGTAGTPLTITFTVVNESAPQSSLLVETPVEMSTVTVDHNWKTIFLQKTFVDPIVVAKPASWNDRDPGVVRLRNITSTSFQIRFQEWNYLDGQHADETVSYLVIERGHWLLPDGGEIEAGSLDMNNNSGTDPFVIVSFDTPFVVTPVVFSTVGTFAEEDAVATRHKDITATGFEMILQEQESGGGHTTETIYWLAWEPGNGEVEDFIGYEAGSQTGVTDAFSTFTLSVVASCFLADIQTFNEPDTATLRYADLSPIDVKVHVDEEQSLDKNTEHVAETVGYIAFECN